MQLSDNGEPIPPEEMNRLFGDFLGEVLRDQTALIFDASGDTRLAEYVRALKGSGSEIAAAVKEMVDTFVNLKASLTHIDRNELFAEARSSPTEQLHRQAEALTALGSRTTLTVESLRALGDATTDFRGNVISLLQQLENAKSSIDSMFDNTVRDIRLAGMTEQEQYDFYQTEAETLYDQALASDSASEIERLAGLVNRDINAAFGLLSSEQQRDPAQQRAYLDRIEAVNAALQARLDALEDEAEDLFNETVDTLAAVVDKLTKDGITAASNQLVASENQLAASNALLKVDVRVDTPATVLVTDGG